MNALRTVSNLGMRVTGRRFASSGIPLPKPPVPTVYHRTTKQDWMSDPSTYPLMSILSFAITFMFGMGLNCALNNEDLHINKYRGYGTIRSHGYERKGRTMTARLALHEGLTGPEGLGVDHDEWVKSNGIKDPLVYSNIHHKTLYHPHWLP